MKVLIIGIDGADNRNFNLFHMPYFQRLLSRSRSVDLVEDLFSRGWAEIVTGKHGMETGAFYMYPKFDGSFLFQDQFRVKDTKDGLDGPLIWELGGDDQTVGIMNIPTTTPVCEVNGFMVGSAGGGISKIDSISGDLVYPQSLIDFLEKNDYVADIRLGSSDISDIEELFEKMILMENKRVDIYIKLCKKYATDFGFIVNRSVACIQYLFKYEIEQISKGALKRNNSKHQTQMRNLLNEFYTNIDNNIKKLVTELNPTNYALVSDHGTVPMRYHCNPNKLLEENGYFKSGPTGDGSPISNLKNIIKKRLPRSIKELIYKQVPTSVKSAMISVGREFDGKNTKAFANYYNPGIYINDDRFFGVVDEKEKYILIKEIIDLVNKNADAKKYNIKASLYRSKYSKSRKQKYLPDIWLDLPDEIFNICEGPQFIHENPAYKETNDLKYVQFDMNSGTKGKTPLCLFDNNWAECLSQAKKRNLELIYEMVDLLYNK